MLELIDTLSNGVRRMEQALLDGKATLQQHTQLLNHLSARLERIELRQRAETDSLDDLEKRIKILERRG